MVDDDHFPGRQGSHGLVTVRIAAVVRNGPRPRGVRTDQVRPREVHTNIGHHLARPLVTATTEGFGPRLTFGIVSFALPFPRTPWVCPWLP